jgi:histone chaperone ASF1
MNPDDAAQASGADACGENEGATIASVQLTELEMLSANPAYFTDRLQWRMRLECLEELPEPITVAFTWIGSAKSDEHDQLLGEFDIGPLTLEVNEVVLEHDAPQIGLIPADELFELTGLYITLSYRGERFLRVNYFAKVAFWDNEHMLNPPAHLDLSYIGRNMLMDRPNVLTFPVDWDSFAKGAV